MPSSVDECFPNVEEDNSCAAALGTPAGDADESSEERFRNCIARRVERERDQRTAAHQEVKDCDGDLLDVDGWPLEPAQLVLAKQAQHDLEELQILAACADRPNVAKRINAAIHEFELRLRCARTWAWLPLTEYQWHGYEYGSPTITVSFVVPGANSLAADDVHCTFGSDWFDLKIWNLEWPDDPGVKRHHRAVKTGLARDIVPAASFVVAKGNRVRVKLQKVFEARHGHCAWPDLCVGSRRRPFRLDDDAPDGGFAKNFLEAEYDKYEGHDDFRRDIGSALEQVHRGQPPRGLE
eukprot:TRINITY_DN39077_c0_g1_i1.p1 TRINITY_DN39077_c0_g1~~TRINITY_DN39077_c0_g1_i1.p1  ORF type:complete len:295 (+),score=56.04 TRINITY_DN39077_c0_g1_i1:57-941(+)